MIGVIRKLRMITKIIKIMRLRGIKRSMRIITKIIRIARAVTIIIVRTISISMVSVMTVEK